MRLWSIHPQYLDPKGLVALWREGLLAQAVLLGRTRGYTRHPQLQRFQAGRDPIALIATYLRHVVVEGERRGYAFDASKLDSARTRSTIPVTSGQLSYEFRHLKAKLAVRNADWLAAWPHHKSPLPHPLFRVADGPVADWERT